MRPFFFRSQRFAVFLLFIAVLLALNHDWSPARTANNQGYVDRESGKLIEALSDYDRAIASRPDWEQPYLGRGIVYLKLRNYDRAVENLAKAIEIAPNDAEPHFERGLAFKANGDSAKALLDFSDAIRLDPSLVTAYFERGVIRVKTGDQSGALADFDYAIDHQKRPEWLVERGKLKFFDLLQFAGAGDDFSASAHEAIRARDSAAILGTKDGTAIAANEAPPGVAIERLLLWTHYVRVIAGRPDALEIKTLSDELAAPVRSELVLRMPIVSESDSAGLKQSLSTWPGPLYALFIGFLQPNELEPVGSSDGAPSEKACDLRFYLALYYRQRDQPGEARALLTESAASCPTNTLESRFANRELAKN